MAHILLAEDDQSMRDFLTLALTKAGHTVKGTADGLEALAELEKDSAYDLLLTDIVMPGMDGIELSQRATKISAELKVMFITGFAAVALGENGRRTGEAKVLSKPFHLKELVGQVNSLLEAA